MDRGNGIHIIDLKDYRNGYECISYTHKLDDPESKVKEKLPVFWKPKTGKFILAAWETASINLIKNIQMDTTHSSTMQVAPVSPTLVSQT